MECSKRFRNDVVKIVMSPPLTPLEKQFLIDMVEHHKMALVMSKKILSSTEDSDIMSLAYSVLLNQKNEIALMQQMIRLRKVQHL